MRQTFNPELLRLAREARGLTQNELARITGISQGNISKYENEGLAVANEHLDRIAEMLEYPKSFFYQDERVYNFASGCAYHRQRQTAPQKVVRLLLAKLNVFRLQVKRLLDDVEIDTPIHFPRYDAVSYRNPAEIAQLVRATWKLPPGPIPNLVRVLEDAGGLVHRSSFGTRKVDAISQRDPYNPEEPPVFLVNTDVSTDRQRFTLAHELGHLVMHHVATENMEGEADAFAAEFLMPAQEIAPHLSHINLPRLAQLKPYWRVSMAALARRALDLGKIGTARYRGLNIELTQAGQRWQEDEPTQIEEPTLLREIIQVYLSEYGYTRETVANLMHAPLDDLLEYLSDSRIPRLVSSRGSEKKKKFPVRRGPVQLRLEEG